MPSGVDGGHRYGDDARVRSRAPLARSDLRFARPVCATGTFEINGSRSSGACVSSERHRRRVGRSLLAQLISAPDRANSLPEAGGAYAKGPRPQSVTAVPPLARSTSLLKASPHTCIRARTSIPCQRRRRGCVWSESGRCRRGDHCWQMARLVTEQPRGRRPVRHGRPRSRARSRLLPRRFEPEAAGASSSPFVAVSGRPR